MYLVKGSKGELSHAQLTQNLLAWKQVNEPSVITHQVYTQYHDIDVKFNTPFLVLWADHTLLNESLKFKRHYCSSHILMLKMSYFRSMMEQIRAQSL